jgi:hypothetical protein
MEPVASIGSCSLRFPDNSWDIHDVVVGPQGVMSQVTMPAHQAAPFAGVNDVGHEVRWRLNNMFPWDPEAKKFRGETLYYCRPESEYFVSKWVAYPGNRPAVPGVGRSLVAGGITALERGCSKRPFAVSA